MPESKVRLFLEGHDDKAVLKGLQVLGLLVEFVEIAKPSGGVTAPS